MYYYKQVENGSIVSVEAKSIDIASPSFVKATKAEYDGFIASLPIDEQLAEEAEQATCEEYLSHSPDVITPPEIWFLIRTFGKKLGYKVD